MYRLRTHLLGVSRTGKNETTRAKKIWRLLVPLGLLLNAAPLIIAFTKSNDSKTHKNNTLQIPIAIINCFSSEYDEKQL